VTPRRLRSTGLWLHAALLAVLAWAVLRFLAHAASVIGYRYGLDFGEGIVWQQALLIPGPRMYGDITRFPFLVFHYPPLYHLISRGVAALGVDGLVAGRLVSLASTLAMCGCLAALAWLAVRARFGRRPAQFAAATGFALPLAMLPVFCWAPMMRVDMLAAALGFAGMLCAAMAPARPGLLPLAGVLFVAALYTRQSAVAAPLAALLVMLPVMPGATLRAMLLAGVIGLAGLLGMTLATDGGFLRHVVGYNVNRFDLARGLSQTGTLALVSLGYVAVAGVAAVLAARDLARATAGRGLPRLLREDQGARAVAMLLAYLAVTTLMLPMAGKSGASINYFIEWSCALALFAGLLGARALALLAALPPGMRPHPGLLMLPALLAWQMIATRPPWHPYLALEARTLRLLALEAELRNAGRPAISDEMVLLIRSGQGVVWESAIFAELASLGRWDEAPLRAMLEAGRFAFVLTDGLPGTALYDSRYTPAISAAIDRAYPRREAIAGGLVLHRPP
jgi:hypothetical protein